MMRTTKTKKKRKKSPTSKSAGLSLPESSVFAEILGSAGHRPSPQLRPQDERLFKSFQSNLLSLISHELRTPLTGILNSLGLLEEIEASGEVDPGSAIMSRSELVRMARQNAERLHRTLVTLLDLASIESGTFHARLREMNLARVVSARVDASAALLKDQGIEVRVTAEDPEGDAAGSAAVLADPSRIGRAIDLCLQAVIPRARKGSRFDIRISASAVRLAFELDEAKQGFWQQAWSQALAGHQGGVASPSSAFSGAALGAFGGVMQSEEAFLTRMEEGLGSELLLIHEILRVHRGRFTQTATGSRIELLMELPSLSSEEGLRAVLSSRAYHITSELGSVALVFVRVPRGSTADQLSKRLRQAFFRSSDAAYGLTEKGVVALVLDDGTPEDAARMMARIAGRDGAGPALEFGAAHCPSDALDPLALVEIAEQRLGQVK